MDESALRSTVEGFFSASVPVSVLVVGSCGVGKSSLIESVLDVLRYVTGSLLSSEDVTGVVHLYEGDTADRYDAVVVVYDVTDSSSLSAACRLLESLCVPNSPFKLLVGNKIDMEYWRTVSVSEGMEVARSVSAKFCELSTLTGQHVDYVVDMMLQLIFERFRDELAVSELLKHIRLFFLHRACSQICLISSNVDIDGFGDDDVDDDGEGIVELGEKRHSASQRSEPRQRERRSAKRRGKKRNVSQQPSSPLKERDAASNNKILDTVIAPCTTEEQRPALNTTGDDIYTVFNADAFVDTDNELSSSDKRLGDDYLDRIQSSVSEIKRTAESIKSELVDHSRNIDKLMDRRVALDDLLEHSNDLEAQAAMFYNTSKSTRRYATICWCCIRCGQFMESCSESLFSEIKDCMYSLWEMLVMKNKLVDNVLTDTDNAFKTLAYTLACIRNTDICYKWICKWYGVLASVVSFVLVSFSAITLILPSFFTILIVRTKTVEKESTAFQARSAALEAETTSQKALRWIRIILRSLPMSFYILGLPYMMVYVIFPRARQQRDSATITIWLVSYLTGVLVLQVLGSVRAYHSWISREPAVPKAPQLYYRDDENESSIQMCACLNRKVKYSNDKSPTTLKKSTPPVAPNTFSIRNPANVIEICSLAFEFVQMASFALQNNPYDDNDDNDDTTSDKSSNSAFWGESLFRSVYVRVTVGTTVQFTMMWAAVGIVGLLLTLFSVQFLKELTDYGVLLRQGNSKDEFFFSFTGAIVYGHGRPNNISPRMRLLISILSDALFLIVSFQLLQVFSCNYTDDVDDVFASLRADESIECWRDDHALLAVFAMVGYSFYVPLSIMITPMLLEVPASNSRDNSPPGVSYMKLYLMVVNVVKSAMLLVVVMGPASVTTTVASTTVSSVFLGAITLLWFRNQDFTQRHYSADMQPCSVDFVNYWKAASYTAAVASAVIVVIAYNLNSDLFPQTLLTTVLVIMWVVVASSFAIAYMQFSSQYMPRQKLVNDLINYPFYFRDLPDNVIENSKAKSERLRTNWLFNEKINIEKRHIPGFEKSPWYDTKFESGRCSISLSDREGSTVTEVLIKYCNLQ